MVSQQEFNQFAEKNRQEHADLRADFKDGIQEVKDDLAHHSHLVMQEFEEVKEKLNLLLQA